MQIPPTHLGFRPYSKLIIALLAFLAGAAFSSILHRGLLTDVSVVVASEPIREGERIAVKRVSRLVASRQLESVIGCKVRRNIRVAEPLYPGILDCGES